MGRQLDQGLPPLSFSGLKIEESWLQSEKRDGTNQRLRRRAFLRLVFGDDSCRPVYGMNDDERSDDRPLTDDWLPACFPHFRSRRARLHSTRKRRHGGSSVIE